MLHLACDETFAKLMDWDELIPVMAIALGCTVAIVAIVAGAIRSMVVARITERTRREIAAYVAEGSIDPDKAIAMLEAGKDDGSGCV